jgi:hypothetical protein
MITAAEFRRMALSLPGATESSHMDHPDFRVSGKIFATLGYPNRSWGMVRLSPPQQALFLDADPEAFTPVKGAWGRQGGTNVYLPAVTGETLRESIKAAWANVAARPLASRSSGRRNEQRAFLPGPKKPLWRCPKCGHRFVTENLWHSCSRYSLTDHFKGKPRVIRQTFNRFVGLAEACGPVTVYAQKTRIVIQGRVRFAGAVVRSQWLDASMWLKRRVEHPMISRIENFGRLGFGIHFPLHSPDDIDPAMADFMREAYEIGQQNR